MSYYKSPRPDSIASPVGIAPRPFIAGGLREWPPRGYIGPTTNYRMPGMSGCGACGGFGQETGSEASPTLDWVVDPGDGTADDSAYTEYTSDVTQAGSGQPAPAPAPVPAPAKKDSIWVPVLLGVGLLGLIWLTREKPKRNAPPGNAARRRYMLRSRARSGRFSYRVARRNAGRRRRRRHAGLASGFAHRFKYRRRRRRKPAAGL